MFKQEKEMNNVVPCPLQLDGMDTKVISCDSECDSFFLKRVKTNYVGNFEKSSGKSCVYGRAEKEKIRRGRFAPKNTFACTRKTS